MHNKLTGNFNLTEYSKIKMTPSISDKMKAHCVLWMHEHQSATVVRRKCRNAYNMIKGIPSRTTINRWYSNFKETGYVMSQEKKGRKKIDNAIVDFTRTL